MEYRWNWLESDLNNLKYPEVFVGYTSYSRRKIVSINNGIFIGYRLGKPFFWMKFRESVPKQKLGQDVYAHHKGLIGLFDKIHNIITSPPLILISSRKAVEWLHTSAYKWLSISEKDKSKLFFYVDMLKPEFKSYDVTTQPFSILRELALKEGNNISSKTAEKSFYDYSTEWSEFDWDKKLTAEEK